MMAVNVNKMKNEQCTGEIPIRTMRRLRRAVAESSLKRYRTLLFAKFFRKIYQTLVQFARKIACSEQHITLNSGRYQQHISRKALNKILIRVKCKVQNIRGIVDRSSWIFISQTMIKESLGEKKTRIITKPLSVYTPLTVTALL